MLSRMRALGAFAWDFVIGDDWVVAAVVVIGLGVTYLLAHASVTAWWLIPALLAVILPVSLWRAVRKS